MKNMISILFVLLSSENVLSSNILYLSTIPTTSNYIWHSSFILGLVDKGHNVTYLCPMKVETQITNYTIIFVEGIYEYLQKNFVLLDNSELSPYQWIPKFRDLCESFCMEFLKSQALKNILSYPRDFKFDLIIFDVNIGLCGLPLLQRFNFPAAIGTTIWSLPPWAGYNFGNHLHPSYMPWYGLPHTHEMTFMERVWNYFFMYGEIVFKLLQQHREHCEWEKIFGEEVVSLKSLQRNISLILINSDKLLNYPQSLAPNFIEVGGLHIKRVEKLERDLQVIMDEAKHGVIIFSLGAYIRSDNLTNSILEAFLDAFRMLKQTVIWKFESKINNLPPNVIVRKWLPQNDILAHPNVKVFIGHAGSLGTQEAIYHGVPMLCIPFLLDQKLNARNVVIKKLGLSMNYKKINSLEVYGKLEELLDNSMYSRNMKAVSAMFRRNKETPLERAVFWAEYVIEHKNSVHLLSTPARDLPFYVTSGVDVLGFFMLFSAMLCLGLYKIVKFILRLKKSKKLKIN